MRAIVLSAIFVNSVHADPVSGILRVVKGEVQIQAAGGKELSRARLGAQVSPHDVIVTGHEGRAKIVMSDGNELNVSPDSRLEIRNYEADPGGNKKDVLLNVIYGKVRAKVEQHYDGKTSRFQVKTPAAVAGVRGTDFIVGFEHANTTVITFRGEVEFGLPGANGAIKNAVSVKMGQMASAESGKSPGVVIVIPKEQLNKMDKESVNTTAANSKQKDGGRGLASLGSAGMMRPEDLPAAGGALPPPVPTVESGISHPPPPAPSTPVCNTCNTLIQNNGSGKLNVHIK